VYNAGDYNTAETVIIPVNTFDSNDPTASVTVTDLAAGDIEIHKDGGVVQRASDSGVTVTINFDGVTGNHIISIDLSDNTDAGFYSSGSRYLVRLEGITVDSGTINAWIGGFSIGCTLRPTVSGRTLDVTATGTSGVDWGNVENQGSSVDLSSTAIDLCDEVTIISGLSNPAVNQITTGILAMVIEGTLTFANVQRLILSFATGKTTGNGLKFRNVADTKDRLTYTVDANHNRTSVVRDGD